MSRSFKKAYKNRNIKRPVSKSCHNNGGCSYCEGNRLHSSNKRNEQSLHGLGNLYDR